MLYLHIETSQERLGHIVMITDQQRLILMNKMMNVSKRELSATKNRNKPKRGQELNLRE